MCFSPSILPSAPPCASFADRLAGMRVASRIQHRHPRILELLALHPVPGLLAVARPVRAVEPPSYLRVSHQLNSSIFSHAMSIANAQWPFNCFCSECPLNTAPNAKGSTRG
eukprot:7130893-Pyramimonas_sp.AAC.1